MAVIPQISNPFSGKGYPSSNLSTQARPGDEQFEIIQLTKQRTVGDAAEKEANRQTLTTPNRTDLPQLLVKTPKDPTMAVETLKQLISADLLATARASGYTELHGELEGLSKSIYLAVNDLVREMLNQESQTTMFAGNQLFDLLRNLVSTEEARLGVAENPDMPTPQSLLSIANFLKAVNFSFNRDEILNAVSSNLRFLSTYFSPSPAVSEKLGGLADAWASLQARENFELLKGETIRLLQNVSESILNNEKTQVLIPLIIHNLSRYNTNDYMLKDAFSTMMTHIPHSQKGAFITAFDEFLESAIYGALKNEGAEKSQSQNAAQVNNNTIAEENQDLFLDKDSFPYLYAQKLASGADFPPRAMTEDSLANGLRNFLLGKIEGMDAITSILSNLIEGAADAQLLIALQSDLAKTESITQLVNYLNDILKQIPDVPERQTLFQMLSETVSEMAEKGELPPDSPEDLAAAAEKTQSSQNTQNPTQAAESRDSGERISLPNSTTPEELVKIVQESQGQEAQKSSLEELTSFIEKNINHSALKTLDSYNASNLLQSLINAPGVYTPLSHFVIPLQIGEAKAFGELWVDSESANSSSGGASKREQNYHLFLTFEIDSVGRFETDLYASGSEINLAVLHPESFSGEMHSLKEKINRIIASTDYSVKEFQTGVLKKPHDLTQIFPRIVEKRKGLDITV